MSDISKIKLPNGDIYNLKDSNALHNNDTYVQDVQINNTSIINNKIANIPIASTTEYGTVKVDPENGIYNQTVGNQTILSLAFAGPNTIKSPSNQSVRPLIAAYQHLSTFYGLAAAAGDTTQSESNNAIGTYTDAAKGAIQHMIGIDSAIAPYEADITADRSYAIGDTFMMNGKLYKATAAIAQNGVITPDSNCVETNVDESYVKDIQINETSITNSGIANIPRATGADYGVTKMATDAVVKAGTDYYSFLTPMRNHISTFYGLAKAAGDTTQVNSSNAIGTYTTEAKTAIQTMLSVPDAANVINDVQINGTSIKNNGIVNVPEMSDTVAGVVKRGSGLYINSSGQLCANIGTASTIKQGTASSAIAPISLQGNTAFYGLAKAAGDTTQSASSNAVGTYTTEAKSAIQTMLNVPDTSEVVSDVQINSTSIISNGVANIPLASTTTVGAVKLGDTMSITGSGAINFRAVGASEVKAGTTYQRALSPERQHASVFYGLTKAAGVDMKNSNNAIGVYTDEAKAAIKSMLGIIDGSTGTIEVSGTTPTITAIENTRYVCGEVSTLSITPPSSGICIIRFTSGTTATVLTVPNTVIWPEWFDATTLEASRVYEICITDGVYGAVMSWPL